MGDGGEVTFVAFERTAWLLGDGADEGGRQQEEEGSPRVCSCF